MPQTNLNDITAFRAQLERSGKRPVSDAALAGRWLTDVFEPTIAAIPEELWGKREAAELYHELLEHRWYLSERAGRDVGLDKAIGSYAAEASGTRRPLRARGGGSRRLMPLTPSRRFCPLAEPLLPSSRSGDR